MFVLKGWGGLSMKLIPSRVRRVEVFLSKLARSLAFDVVMVELHEYQGHGLSPSAAGQERASDHLLRGCTSQEGHGGISLSPVSLQSSSEYVVI
uniref:Uncharacterized protein n=1 Tax=Timema poppense TaxID=170557 RepID=A0A7R9HGY5_TIMPO|nr:unnamed protein product [Timema poppensis]